MQSIPSSYSVQKCFLLSHSKKPSWTSVLSWIPNYFCPGDRKTVRVLDTRLPKYSVLLINSPTCYLLSQLLLTALLERKKQFQKPRCWKKPCLTLARALLRMGSDINTVLGKMFLEQTKLAFREGKKLAPERGGIDIFLGVWQILCFPILVLHEPQLCLFPLDLARHLAVYPSSRRTSPQMHHTAFVFQGSVTFLRNNTETIMMCSRNPKNSLFLSL